MVQGRCCVSAFSFCFFFNDTATTEIYTLSLHDALPISVGMGGEVRPGERAGALAGAALADGEQAAEPRVGRAVGGVDQDGGGVGQVEPAADDEADASVGGALVGADDAGQRVAVGDAERGQAEQ